MRRLFSIFVLITVIFISGCGDDPVEPGADLAGVKYDPIPYVPSIPEGFPPLEQPAFNTMTIDGVTLGRKLFYDPILSGDSSMSCASCHFQNAAFTDNKPVSTGIDGIAGERSAMSLLNIGFSMNGLFWDGRSATLEEQALLPIEDPVEFHTTWTEVVDRLKDHPEYPTLFRKAFGIESSSDITKELAAYALAQFERTLISSGNSRFDQWWRGEIFLTDSEYNGYVMFFDASPDLPDAECAHCHPAPLFTTNEYLNNGLQESATLTGFEDLGHGPVTGDLLDNGRFRVPSLRNIFDSAPYMHDGRIETIEEVIEHYNSGGKPSPNRDALIYPLNLSSRQKRDLIAFLRTLDDPDFLADEEYSNPF